MYSFMYDEGDDEDLAIENMISNSVFDLDDGLWDNYYAYTGSRTYPPCTEDVHWNVFTKIGEISENQLKFF
jgi:carbonic anhydrase